MTLTFRVAAVLVGAFVSGSAATAVSAQTGRSPTKIAEAVQAQPPAAVDDEDTATCSKSRKRLWVEGEGWIVRRITICR